MHSLRQLGTVAMAGCILLGAGCKPSLDVTNPNQPDIPRALATPQDVKTLASSSFNTWYFASTTEETYVMLAVTSDASTMNFGNFGARFNNLEPRIPYSNNSASNDKGVSEVSWQDNYGALGAANDALRAFAGGIKLSSQAETDKYRRLAQFTQAASMTNLALNFDKAFIVDETVVPGTPLTMQPYSAVSADAVKRWAALAADAAGKSDSYDPKAEVPLAGGTFTSAKMARVANTFAALTMAYTPRNAADAASKVDWAKVLQFANNGIGTGNAGAPFDFTIVGDATNWYSNYLDYATSPSWMNVDQRVIHLMDPGVPAKFDGTFVPPTSQKRDARLGTDFVYTGSVVGNPARGIYMQSPYYAARYDYYSFEGSTEAIGPAPYILAAESDLVRAEALIRTSGNLQTAADLINITRVGRGQMTPATAADGAATLLKDIEYERDIELFNTNGWVLFQRRHVDGLQPGTVHHLPVPASELETLGLPVYTFGGVGQPVESIETMTSGMFAAPFGSRVSLRKPGGTIRRK